MNRAVAAVQAPPIADANEWVSDLAFPADRPLLDVAQAVPSYPPAEALARHVGRAARERASAVYAPILGLDALREAFARHLSECYRAPVRAGEVAITAGCNQAFCAALSAIAGPGDEVLLPVPWYFNHQMWLQMQGVSVRPLAFDESRAGVPSPEDAARAITSRTRAMVLVTPNNPTGGEYPSPVLDGFLALARERDLVLVVDETYKDFRSRAGVPHDLFAYPDWREHFVSLHSFSKSYAMAGYRVGALVCGPRLMSQVRKIQDCIAICAPRISQQAALFALDELDAWRDQKVSMMAARVGALRESFAVDGLRYALVSAGAYFAWVRHPFEGCESGAVARRLAREHGVLCVPGATFGPGLDAYLRFAFANLEAEAMPALVERLIQGQ
jgi:aspartate/methionine/tyrosine aminotransferase